MSEKTQKIIDLLSEKSVTKQIVYHNTLNVFKELKTHLQEIIKHIKINVKDFEKEVRVSYNDKGLFEAEITFGGDILVFSMHTNVFSFNQNHAVYNTEYVKENKGRIFCGIIHIYNFLADSLKYGRKHDSGFLIGRVFINKEYDFFVEGKHQLGYPFNTYGDKCIDKEALTNIIESAIIYSLEFDLLTPPIEAIQEISVMQKIEQSGILSIKTGKRLGFRFTAENDQNK